MPSSSAFFANPVWRALSTHHRHLAVCAGSHAARYPAPVAPFAAVSEPTEEALQHLRTILADGESVWLVGEHFPAVAGLRFDGTLPCLQMVLPSVVSSPLSEMELETLDESHAAEMVALTDIAFPGFFRERTCEMGRYYGLRSIGGELVAMGGERLRFDGYSEISGVCTHPQYRGHGFATHIIQQLVQDHCAQGVTSFLHVGCANISAIQLYRQLGFQEVGRVMLHRIVQTKSTDCSTSVSYP